MNIEPLLSLIEKRFGLHLESDTFEHLCEVHNHYKLKKEIILRQYGEHKALQMEDYAKYSLISEATRILILREIMPRPKKKRK